MYFFIFSVDFIALTLLFCTASALGINCRGSELCPYVHTRPPPVTQVIQKAVEASELDPSTVYNSGDHISCVIRDHVCLFPQNANLTLEKIRPLVSAVIEHGCKKCGSVPVHFVDGASNDPRWGILTFNYVHTSSCTGNCIPASDFAESRVREVQNSYAPEVIQS